ncbi:hypothetical protein HZA97_02055 [Candidatus Woesearchaeota archaeon]|nr:hypothetical protein [Candidatus Woesearchaeota archaeon]
MDKKSIELYSWISRGSQRVIMLQNLNVPLTPTQLAKTTGIKVTNVSDNLRLMDEKNLVKCLNPKEKMGRLYELTKEGKKIAKFLK